MKCICGSEKIHTHCCTPLLQSKKIATSAEQLMRSRFTAFATKNFSYLRETTAPRSAKVKEFEQNEAWANEVEFLNLEIIKSDQGPEEASVEFKVYYCDYKTVYCSHEINRFLNINNIWFYFDSHKANKKS